MTERVHCPCCGDLTTLKNIEDWQSQALKEEKDQWWAAMDADEEYQDLHCGKD